MAAFVQENAWAMWRFEPVPICKYRYRRDHISGAYWSSSGNYSYHIEKAPSWIVLLYAAISLFDQIRKLAHLWFRKRIDPLVEAGQNQGMVPVFAPIGTGSRTVSHKIRQKLDWRSLFSSILNLLGHRQSLFRPFLWLTLSDSAFPNRCPLHPRPWTGIL